MTRIDHNIARDPGALPSLPGWLTRMPLVGAVLRTPTAQRLLRSRSFMEKIAYLFFGALTTAVDFIIFYAMNSLLGIDYRIATSVAWVLAVVFAFFTNKMYVFASRRFDSATLMREAPSFFAARAASFLFNYGWMVLAVERIGLGENISKILANIVVIIMNYVFSKLFIFKKRDGGGGGNIKNANDGRSEDDGGGLPEDDGGGLPEDDGGGLPEDDGGALPEDDGGGLPEDDGGMQPDAENDSQPAGENNERPEDEGDRRPAGDNNERLKDDGGRRSVGDNNGKPKAENDWWPEDKKTVGSRFARALRRNYLAILSFFVPAGLLCAAFAAVGISPLGNGSMLIVDNFHQYTPFLMEFGDMLREGRSLMHSWNAGLGTNFLARYAYYLSSPLNFLSVFVPRGATVGFVLALTIGRAGGAGLAFFTYLREKHGRSKMGAPALAFSAMYALGAYFLAYYWNIMWFDCIALLPVVALGIERIVDRGRARTYVIALGITIISNFFIAIMVCIFCVLYFIVYSFSKGRRPGGTQYAPPEGHRPGRDQQTPSQRPQPGGDRQTLSHGRGLGATRHPHASKASLFAGTSALAGALSAVVTLPAFYGLLQSSAAGAKLPSAIRIYSNILDILSNHLTMIKPSIMVGLPNIYCGIAVFFLVPAYFANRRIDAREKICNGLLLAFFIFSFNINYLDFYWHGTHFPNSLLFRFAFLYVFVLLAAAYKALTRLDGVGPGLLPGCLAAACAFMFYMETQPTEKLTKLAVYISFAWALAIFGALTLVRQAKVQARALAQPQAYAQAQPPTHVQAQPQAYAQAQPPAHAQSQPPTHAQSQAQAHSIAHDHAKGHGLNHGLAHAYAHAHCREKLIRREFFLFMLIAVEIGVNAGFGIGEAGVLSSEHYISRLDEILPAVEWAKGQEARFERIEFTEHTTYNTPVVYGYKGVSHYSSTSNVAVNNLFGKLGLIHSSAWYVYRSAPPTLNAMFSVRYLLDKNSGEGSEETRYDNGIYPLARQEGAVGAFKNPYWLPIGFATSAELRDWDAGGGDPFRAQEDFFKKATGGASRALFVPLRLEEQNLANVEVTGGEGGNYRFRRVAAGKDMKAEFSVTAPFGGPVYFYAKSSRVERATVRNGAKTQTHSIKYPYIMDAQFVRAGGRATVELDFESSDGDSFTLLAYAFDEIAFQEAHQMLESGGLAVERYSDTSVFGRVDARQRGLLFLSIPYSGGWSATVDGAPAAIEDIGDGALMALEIEAGRHEVELRYRTQGLALGATISIAALATLALAPFAYSMRASANARRRRNAVPFDKGTRT